MIELNGKYNKAIVYTDQIENKAISQLINLCNQEFVKESKIRIMPDVHTGKGCCIGTTLTYKDKIVPNLVGVDIGCGMLSMKLKQKDINLVELDMVIREEIPSGFNIRNFKLESNRYVDYKDLKYSKLNLERIKHSLGTLGGGNHFIEIDKDSEGSLYLIIHSGSRYFGKQIAEYYQEIAAKNINKFTRQNIIKEYKRLGKESELESILKQLPKIPKEFAYLEKDDLDNYLNDIAIVQFYANLNRLEMGRIINEKMGIRCLTCFQNIHNYVDITNKIIRKGAIAASESQPILIPLNMRDGCILARGKGNPDWNYSAPHGAGRLMSRRYAKENLTLAEYRKEMDGIYSTCIDYNTLDESPMAYKPIEVITKDIEETADIVEILKPIYNFKA